MFNFFASENSRIGNYFEIVGGDCNHIKNVLRMKIKDQILVSFEGKSHLCEISSIDERRIVADIIEENYNDTSLPISICLFQGLPKADKMEFIIQKAVELGVDEIIPVEMENCVVKLDAKKKGSKITRWQAIAESAAKQSKRNNIPTVGDVLSFKECVEKANDIDVFLVPYECKEGMSATKDALKSIKSGMTVGILIGPEGGFSQKEIDAISEDGKGKIISLGKRILRTETAAITAVSMCMLYAETELCDD
ncbi:MAG: 16S rRNA (uracil(1498)-N(3))-methyltransferase [Clostridia bacterium]|nr:16S rRNA (uracil(1498)-N(3))-methyltransferase [Clostridia bacterium]